MHRTCNTVRRKLQEACRGDTKAGSHNLGSMAGSRSRSSVCVRTRARALLHPRPLHPMHLLLVLQTARDAVSKKRTSPQFWCIRSLEELRNNLVLSRASDNDVTDLSVRFHMILLNDKKNL